MATRVLASNSQWSIRRSAPAGVARRRGAAAAPPPIPPEFLQSSAVDVEEVFEAQPAAGRRGTTAAATELPLDVDVKPDEVSLIAIRHASGALTFHASTEPQIRSARRRGGAATRVDRYRIPVRTAPATAPGRRGLVSKAIKVVILKVAKAAVDKAAGAAMRFLAEKVEAAAFTKRGLSEGWFKVAPAGGSLQLTAGTPPPNQRSLILVHGTFSNAGAAYGDLASTDFFERVRPLYGDRVFAFNHFSVSRTPIDNAQAMLTKLKPGNYAFDAITHSRGGLVLRALVEQRGQLGSATVKATFGHAVLVAAPNDGTPLATPSRWEETVGWFGNLLELFPDNPLTTVAEFVSEAIVWLAARVASDLPGLRAMDGGGDLIAALQLPPGPPANTYSAIASNYHPTSEVFARALDVGVDAFFATANDLVVPSEGGWLIDRGNGGHIPGARIGCFGPGGNLARGSTTLVHHMNFFAQPDTVDFLAKALAGKPQGRPSIDPATPLPSQRFGRRGGEAVTPAADAIDSAIAPPLAAAGAPPVPSGLEGDVDTFHIVVMDDFDANTGRRNDPGRDPAFTQVYATYGGARVTQAMRVHQDRGHKGAKVVDPAAKTAFGDIIRTHERIKKYTDLATGSLPDDEHLKGFGSQLFNTLFQGDVRRLYDEARSRQRGRRLDLILTSMVPWIAEKPWEFAYDDTRKSFLATEEIHFIRNVLTSVPADPIIPVNGPLRILVAAAQPVAFGMLAIEDEIDVIRRGFQPMVENNLVTIDVLAQATPAGIHGYISTGSYNVVHFIGHGEFNKEKNEGCLVFEDGRGGDYRVGERSLREIFCQRGLSLVFLNACQTGTGGRSDFNKGVAQALVSHGLPALVANQYSVLDSSATSFAQHFYFSLAQGLSLGQSAREARIAVNYALQGEPIDWAIPVLYARDPNRTLCAKPAQPIRVPITQVRPTSRRAVKDHTLKIAVWDIDEVFPELDRTLQTLNTAQTVFGFQEAKLSLPLDVWDLVSEPGTRYLQADQLAKRLQGKPSELHVDLVICVTRQWMRDQDWFNLYGWWNENQKPRVAVCSIAGFDQLKSKGPETERVIANNLVSVLAGFFGSLGTHPRGAQDCPLAFNESRDWKYVAGELAFDKGCREKLRQRPAQLRAMDALLKLFRSSSSRSAKTGK